MDESEERLLILAIEELGGKVETLANSMILLSARIDDMSDMFHQQTTIAEHSRISALRALEELRESRESFERELRHARRERPTDPDLRRYSEPPESQ